MSTVRTDRLRQLAAFIVGPDRFHEWDFNYCDKCAYESTRELFADSNRADDVANLYGLNPGQINRLFEPASSVFPDESVLPATASAEEVAANILAFCDEIEAGVTL